MWMPNFLRKFRLKRELAEYALLFINVCGGFPFWTGSRTPLMVYYAFLLSGYVLVIASSIVAAAARTMGSFIGTVSTLNAIFTSLNSAFIQLLTVINQRKLGNYLKIMDENFYSYSNELGDYRPMLRRGILIQNWILFWISYGWMTAVSVHPISLFLKPDLIHNPFMLFYISWMPWEINSIGTFLVVYTIQAVSTVPHELSMLGNLGFVLNTLLETRHQSSRLVNVIDNLISRRPGITTTTANEAQQNVLSAVSPTDEWRSCPRCSETEFKDRLKECTQHYEALIRGFGEYKSWFEWAFAVYLVYGVITFGLLTYTALGIRNPVASIKYLAVVISYAFGLYIYCQAGELISTWNEDITNALYNMPWYELTPNERKNVLIFRYSIRDRMKLKGIKIYPASLAVFATVMKISYSYFNLLRTYESYRGQSINEM